MRYETVGTHIKKFKASDIVETIKNKGEIKGVFASEKNRCDLFNQITRWLKSTLEVDCDAAFEITDSLHRYGFIEVDDEMVEAIVNLENFDRDVQVHYQHGF